MHGVRKGNANLFLTELVGLISRTAMPRRARIALDELVYHTLNRANGRSDLFSKPEDYAALTESFSMQ